VELIPRWFKTATKAAPSQSAIDAGWQSRGFAFGQRPAAANPRELFALMSTYGGPDDGITWVHACVSLIMSELASYPYEITTLGDRILPNESIPNDLADLLDQPNEDMTYFDFIEYKQMDEELAGNSYWLKDQMNAIGQPLALRPLRPEFVKIAVNDAGRLIGYVYEVQGFETPIPYDRDEVIQFRRPHPTNEYYGMGVVEAIQRALKADLAQTDHITGFFEHGAKLSGVLTTGTLSEIQFERFKQQFYEEFVNDPNTHGILVAEQGTRYDPLTASPGGSGVIDLRKMSKDEVLTAFGIPAPLLGGVLDDANHKVEDSQHIFSRKMVPRARRTSEKLTRDLIAMWRLKFKVNVRYAETRTTKIQHAQESLKGGASTNESRAIMDLPPHAEAWADIPVLPQGFAPFGFMESGGAPTRQQQPSSPADDGRFALIDHHKEMVDYARARYDDVLNRIVRGQRTRTSKAIGRFTENGSYSRDKAADRPHRRDLSVATVWNHDAELNTLMNEWDEATRSICDITCDTPLLPTQWSPPSPYFRQAVQKAMFGVETWNTRICEQLEEMIKEANRRGYNLKQLASGNDEEAFSGVLSVFDRVETEVIPRTTTRAGLTAVNLAMLASYAAANHTHVEVIQTLNGATLSDIWTIERALKEPSGIASTDRVFLPSP